MLLKLFPLSKYFLCHMSDTGFGSGSGSYATLPPPLSTRRSACVLPKSFLPLLTPLCPFLLLHDFIFRWKKFYPEFSHGILDAKGIKIYFVG